MVALRRTTGGTLSGLVASVLMPPGARAWQIPRPHAGRACVTWTAPRQAANLPSVSITNDLPGREESGRAGLHGKGRAMSHSMYTAGRTTHLKVVVLSLLCAIVFAVVGLTARMGEMNGATSRTEASGPVIRGGAPKTVTSNEQNTIR